MRGRTSIARIGAVVLAVALGGSYVWFRAAQAKPEAAVTSPRGAAPSTHPATKPRQVLSSSKFSALNQNLSHRNDSGPIGAGFKLNNSISAEFAVGTDICAGIEQPSDKTLPGWDK